MARSALYLVVVLAVVLAGCSGFFPGNDGTATPTVTPPAVPTDEPTPTPVPRLAPGLTGQGVTDAVTLAEAHANVLDDTSFTVHDETLVRFVNGTVAQHTATDAELAANDTRYSIAVEQSGPSLGTKNTAVAVWSNAERIIASRTAGENTSYGVPRGLDGEPLSPDERYWTSLGYDPIGDERIYTLFGAAEMRVINEIERNGTTLYELAATNVTNRARFAGAGVDDPQNVSFRAQVTSRGLVQEYRLEYTGTRPDRTMGSDGNETVTVRRTMRYSAVGTTTVERPPWHDAAIANVSTTTA